jgi:anti-anti-sigma factor
VARESTGAKKQRIVDHHPCDGGGGFSIVDPKRIFELKHEGHKVHCQFLIEHLVARYDLDTLFNYLNQLVQEQEGIQLVLDFYHVSNISSVFIGELMALASRTNTAKGSIELINVNDQVHEILVLTYIDKHIPIKRSENHHKNPVSKLAAKRAKSNQSGGNVLKKIKSLALKPFGQ